MKRNLKIFLPALALLGILAMLSLNVKLTAGAGTDEVTVNVGDGPFWGQFCEAEGPDDEPSKGCSWGADVKCCEDTDSGKTGEDKPSSGDSESGWTYKCNNKDCPEECNKAEAQEL